MTYLYEALGINWYADRAELAAFNAIPAMATPDWWARQYLEEPNQPYCENMIDGDPFYDDNTWSTTFGLEPNYPCCTVNHPQGWPKFLSNSYMQVGTNGLAHALLSPAAASVALRSGQVNVSCDTAYPFSDILRYTVDAQGSFDFYLRVPAWADSDASITVNGKQSSLSPHQDSGLHKVPLRKGKSQITYSLPSKMYTTSRENETVAVYVLLPAQSAFEPGTFIDNVVRSYRYKGNVLYALEITNYNTSTLPKPWYDPNEYYNSSYAPPEVRDWEYHNTSAWVSALEYELLCLRYLLTAIPFGMAELRH